MKKIFLHGLDSSSKGTKARWFKKHFPGMVIPDFTGSLNDRMKTLSETLAGQNDLVIVGSSFGGLMATMYTQQNQALVKKLILLAPALNFPEFGDQQHQKKRHENARYYIILRLAFYHEHLCRA